MGSWRLVSFSRKSQPNLFHLYFIAKASSEVSITVEVTSHSGLKPMPVSTYIQNKCAKVMKSVTLMSGQELKAISYVYDPFQI